ncbi:MAG: hypothetical protein A2W91_06755 [Bacteroidetes bacterium GWF2_38_335]|nr:MAG: hypothetical protein A2W91_06755 [Bacteroidetes bacterium GWF2_38_335]OFY79850.1 MAG: hypothetical protein A2281_09325 [Bacteroidetes bacterium RIFOXYA12_FULL_38_20]HBS84916.1 hypothetical protein [Bacteroidales bacterium]
MLLNICLIANYWSFFPLLGGGRGWVFVGTYLVVGDEYPPLAPPRRGKPTPNLPILSGQALRRREKPTPTPP